MPVHTPKEAGKRRMGGQTLPKQQTTAQTTQSSTQQLTKQPTNKQ